MDHELLNDSSTTNHRANIKLQSMAIPPEGDDGSISWTASEFIAHHKSVGWYLVLALITIVLDFGIWLVTKDKITTAVILLVVLLFAISAGRKPRELDYSLDNQGLKIGNRFIAYNELKAYTIVKEGAFSSLVFTPMKRFSAWVRVYYDPADEGKIIALLSSHLPLEEKHQDWTDRLMWRIKF